MKCEKQVVCTGANNCQHTSTRMVEFPSIETCKKISRLFQIHTTRPPFPHSRLLFCLYKSALGESAARFPHSCLHKRPNKNCFISFSRTGYATTLCGRFHLEALEERCAAPGALLTTSQAIIWPLAAFRQPLIFLSPEEITERGKVGMA